MTSQTLNLVAAWIGALAGLAVAPPLPNEAALAAAFTAMFILWLSRVKHRRALTLTLCLFLGFACTRLTSSLVS